MKETRVANRYAKALLKIAQKEGIVEKIRNDISLFQEMLLKDKWLKAWVMGSEVSHTRRNSLLQDLAKGLGLSETFSKFLQQLVIKNRIDCLKEIALSFNAQADDAEGIIRGELTVNDLKMAEEVSNKIKNIFQKKSDKNLIINAKEDKKVVGGFILKVRDKILDASIRRSLEEMRDKLCQ